MEDPPQAGLGEPTWPLRLSPSSIEDIGEVVSVIPYPSITRPPKQLPIYPETFKALSKKKERNLANNISLTKSN